MSGLPERPWRATVERLWRLREQHYHDSCNSSGNHNVQDPSLNAAQRLNIHGQRHRNYNSAAPVISYRRQSKHSYDGYNDRSIEFWSTALKPALVSDHRRRHVIRCDRIHDHEYNKCNSSASYYYNCAKPTIRTASSRPLGHVDLPQPNPVIINSRPRDHADHHRIVNLRVRDQGSSLASHHGIAPPPVDCVLRCSGRSVDHHKSSPPRKSPSKVEVPSPASSFSEFQRHGKQPSIGFVAKLEAQPLTFLLDKGIASYFQESLNEVSSINDYKHIEHVRPSKHISGRSLYHYRSPKIGKKAIEDWIKKHREKKLHASKSSRNVAFGRSHSSNCCKTQAIDESNVKSSMMSTKSILKSRHGKLNARREVLKAIQDYHINSQARAELLKRANEYEIEKREKKKQKEIANHDAAT